MTAPSVSRVLRDAADLIEQRAAAATPGPWFACEGDYEDEWQVGCEPPSGMPGAWFVADNLPKKFAKWAAFVHPGIAAPLAAWLRTEADELEAANWADEDPDWPSLLLARAILGGQS